MFIIKFSTPWSHIDFNTRIGKFNNNKNYRYDFSDSCSVCDFWIIWGGIKKDAEKVLCPPQNIIYITDEVHKERVFSKYFLNQFASVITSRKDVDHKHVIPCIHELNTWLINRDFDFLISDNIIQKSKVISVVCSDQTWLPGHKLRFAFVNKLIGHFKDKLDVFGRGFNPIDDKFDALAPYKYSVAIENSATPGYFTEKITDCYLANTMPIYYGCPDIADYFNPDSFLLINPDDYKNSILKIEKLIEADTYQTISPILDIEKRKYLVKYHIFSKIPQILESEFSSSGKRKYVTIKNEALFINRSLVRKLVNLILN